MNKNLKRTLYRIISISTCILTLIPFIYSLSTIYIPYDKQSMTMKRICSSSLYQDYRPFKIDVPDEILKSFQITTDDKSLLCISRLSEVVSTRILPSGISIILCILCQFQSEKNTKSLMRLLLHSVYIFNAFFLLINTFSNLFQFLYTIGKCPETTISFGTLSPLPFADDCYMSHFLVMIILYFFHQLFIVFYQFFILFNIFRVFQFQLIM